MQAARTDDVQYVLKGRLAITALPARNRRLPTAHTRGQLSLCQLRPSPRHQDNIPARHTAMVSIWFTVQRSPALQSAPSRCSSAQWLDVSGEAFKRLVTALNGPTEDMPATRKRKAQ